MSTVLLEDNEAIPGEIINISPEHQLTIPQIFCDIIGLSERAECFVRGKELVIRPINKEAKDTIGVAMLKDLARQGYSGEELYEAYISKRKKLRGAAEKMLSEGEVIAGANTAVNIAWLTEIKSGLCFTRQMENVLKCITKAGLKAALKSALMKISDNPYCGVGKVRNMTGFYSFNLPYEETDYEIIYQIVEKNGENVAVVAAITAEDFYISLKQFLSRSSDNQLPP